MNPQFDMFYVVVKLFHETQRKSEVQRALDIYYTQNKDRQAYNQQIFKFLRSEARKSLKLEIFNTKRRKGIKYSGWRRHQNDHGSLGPNVIKDFEYSIPQDEVNLEQKLFQTLLSVLESRTLSSDSG
jgi:hypothetical protein